jgi:hypothetical protein
LATSVSLGYCPWLAGTAFSDTIGRLDVAAGTLAGGTIGGVLQSVTNPLQVLAVSGMNISVGVGSAVIPSASGATQGAYRPVNPSVAALTVATAPGSPNTRIDLVVINVVDSGNSSSFAEVQLITGTPANPGVAPAAPTDSIILAQIAVGSGVSSILQANITDERYYTVGPGGAIWCPNMSGLPAVGQLGQLGFDMVNQRLFHLSASGAAPLHVLSFALVEAISTSNLTATFGSEATLLSVSCTSPGGIDLYISAQVMDMIATTNPFGIDLRIYIDSTLVEQAAFYSTTTKIDGTNYRCGAANVVYQTSATKGTTPSAGSHTIQFRAQPLYMSATNTVTLLAASSFPIDLTAEQAVV